MPTLDSYAALRASLDRAAFLSEIGAVAVLVRLDERGGRDEPAPWAFHASERAISDLLSDMDTLSSDESDEVAVAGKPPVHPHAGSPDEETTRTSGPPPLSIPAARGQASVHVVRPRAGARFEAMIGRAADCDVVVPERSVSKHHARLVVVDEPMVAGPGGLRRSYTIFDVGSSNGLAVNGRAARPGAGVVLQSGDVVDLGDVTVLFLDGPGFYEHLPRMLE